MATDEAPLQLPPIEALNQASRRDFDAALKLLFEPARPLAQRLYAGRPFRSYAELLDRAATVLATLPEADQIAVLNAHPRIGERASAVRRRSALSYREQGYDRDATRPMEENAATQAELAALNRRYEERFGFRFVVFVNRRPKEVILDVLRQRLGNPRDQELRTALHELLLIARDRLAVLQTS